MADTHINLDYTPRPWQGAFEREIGTRKRAFLLWARRHGKDVACWNYLILKAIQTRGSYYYLYPRQNQARKAIWEGMTSEGKKFIEYIPKELLGSAPNNTEMRITLFNGSIIRILGSDNHDSLRGTNPMGVVLSEFAWHHPDTWKIILEPIMLENKGWALFNTTPFGKNHAFDLWQIAQKHPKEWYTEKVTNKESKLISDDEFQKMREQGKSEEIIQQEYFCSFDRGIDGNYYGRIIHDLRQRERIRKVDYDTYLPVHTAWDIGFTDSTAIWFYQLQNNEIHVIDYYENQGEGVPHYCKTLEDKRNAYGWTYGTHFAPHDAGAGSFDLGMTRAKYYGELGIKMMILPRNKIHEGIEIVRELLQKCYFDEKRCKRGLECLENYRKVFNDKLQIYSDTPLHDWSSNGADAFRYLAQAVKFFQGASKLGLDEYRKLKRQHGVGGLSKEVDPILGD